MVGGGGGGERGRYGTMVCNNGDTYIRLVVVVLPR